MAKYQRRFRLPSAPLSPLHSFHRSGLFLLLPAILQRFPHHLVTRGEPTPILKKHRQISEIYPNKSPPPNIFKAWQERREHGAASNGSETDIAVHMSIRSRVPSRAGSKGQYSKPKGKPTLGWNRSMRRYASTVKGYDAGHHLKSVKSSYSRSCSVKTSR